MATKENTTTTEVSKEVKKPAFSAQTHREFVFGRQNYMLMFVGLAVLAIGFALMAGSDEGDIFEARRITIAPIIVLAGFVIEIFAIFKKPRG